MSTTATPPERSRDAKRLGRRASVGIIGAAVNGLFTFVLVIVVTRGLGAEGSGVFFVAVAVMTILAGISGLGADTGLIFTVPNLLLRGANRSLTRQFVVAIVPVVVLGLVAAVVMWFLAEPLATWIGGPGTDVTTTADCLRVLALFLPLVPVYEVLLAATRSFDHIVTSVVIDKIMRPVFQPIAVGVAVAAGSAAPGGPGGVGVVLPDRARRRAVGCPDPAWGCTGPRSGRRSRPRTGRALAAVRSGCTPGRGPSPASARWPSSGSTSSSWPVS